MGHPEGGAQGAVGSIGLELRRKTWAGDEVGLGYHMEWVLEASGYGRAHPEPGGVQALQEEDPERGQRSREGAGAGERCASQGHGDL